MNQPLYITSACTISAQHTYDRERFLDPVISTDDGKLFAIDPDYTRFINPVAIRRMSRMLKRGITAGMKCLEDAGVTTPDAIIVGTARGSVTDMENFLKDMINMEEQALNPTAFIQSTYNSVNGWLAMLTKCTNYNQTYVSRSFTFELCLLDAQLLLAETADKMYVLAGAFDELTSEYFMIRTKIGYYKAPIPNSLTLLQEYNTPGCIGGEGAHFFTLSNDPVKAACALHSIVMLQKPTAAELQSAINSILLHNDLSADDLDVLLCGMNGDSRNRFLIDPLIAHTAPHTTIVAFKHLSGEYDTASGFGLWLADQLFRQQQIPSQVIYKQGSATVIKNMLFCNVTIAGNVSLMIVKSVVPLIN